MPVNINDRDRFGSYLGELESQILELMRQRDGYRHHSERLALQLEEQVAEKQPEREPSNSTSIIEDSEVLKRLVYLEGDLGSALRVTQEWRTRVEQLEQELVLTRAALKRQDEAVVVLFDLIEVGEAQQ